VTDDNAELLGMIGRVEPPTTAALELAREVLWSAIADETFSDDQTNSSTTGTARPSGASEQVDRRLEGPAS
jgi:hypothetical protein